MKSKLGQKITVASYAKTAIPHLQEVLDRNEKAMDLVAQRLIQDVKAGKSLFVGGSGHSALLSLELYHRAGGPSFLIPLVCDSLLPAAGPSMVRLWERSPETAKILFDRARPKASEMVWIFSQSGINSAVVELALEAQKRGLFAVAFTSLPHSQSVHSRHPSQKKLFELCPVVLDFGGYVGDAALQVSPGVAVGPLSTLTGVFLAHSILCAAMAHLEQEGVRCSYVSVNTPEGEQRNRKLEEDAQVRDPLLR